MAFSNTPPTCTEIVTEKNLPSGLNTIHSASDLKGILKKKIKDIGYICGLYVWLHKELRSIKMGRGYMKWSFSDSKDIFILGSHEDTVHQIDF